MSTQYIINETGERVSVILGIKEYRELLAKAGLEDETNHLMRSPANAARLRQAMKDVREKQNCYPHKLSDND